MSIPWNDWYHITCNTYGTWLRGDPRGWRERHHRDHIDGDYKHRPKPGTGADELSQSQSSMKRDEVRLNKQLQLVALVAIVTTLLNNGVEILVVSLDDHHLHILARFRDRQPRKRMGWAKFYATKAVKRFIEIETAKTHGIAVGFQLDLKVGEGLWSKRGKETPITGREHQLNTVEYVADHGPRGAEVYLHPNAERWLIKLKKSKESPRRCRGS